MTTLSIVDEPGGAALLGFADPAGTLNPYGVGIAFARDFELDMGQVNPEYTAISRVTDGDEIVQVRAGLTQVRFRMKVTGSTLQDVIDTLGYISQLLTEGGRYLEFAATADVDRVWIPFEPSPSLQMFTAQKLILELASRSPVVLPDIDVFINRQPYAVGPELLPALNLVTNPTLTHDFGGTASRPDEWDWTSAADISAESIISPDPSYSFDVATADMRNFHQSTAVGTAAPGDVWTFSFYARWVNYTQPKMRASLQFLTSAGGPVGAGFDGPLTALTLGKWQRLTVTSTAAPATTSRVQAIIQVDNDTAGVSQIRVRNAQVEKASAASAFRVPAAAVAYNPTSTVRPRKLAVWGEGNAPSPAQFKLTADALTLARARVYRVSERAVDILKATLHKSLRSGTLGADTASTADADGIDGNVAAVTYTNPDPTFGTDAVTSGLSAVGTPITITKPASLAVGDFMVAYTWFAGTFAESTQVGAQQGWSQLGLIRLSPGGSTNQILYVWTKFADADDVAAASFDFDVLYQSFGAVAGYRAWIGRTTNIDANSPIDTFRFNSEIAVTALPTLLSLGTTGDDAMIVGIVAGVDDGGAGSMSYTAPTGTTPTYAEQDDGQTNVTWQGAAAYTGVLATAGSTGDKDATATLTGYWTTCHIALRKAPASLVPRSTVTFPGSGAGAIPPGAYDVFLRYRTTAACHDRLRVEYALKASPTAWIALPDWIVDTRNAATFTEYHEHLMGRLNVPSDRPLDTLTVRVSAGRESESVNVMRLDMVYLAPAFEHSALLSSATALASGEHLYTDAATGGAFHLASDSDLAATVRCDGPTPLELVPGFQVLVTFGTLLPLAGFVDPATEITASPTASVTHSPRYRT